MAVQKAKTDTIVIRIDSDLKEKLQKLADEDSRKLSDYIRLQLSKIASTTQKKSYVQF